MIPTIISPQTNGKGIQLDLNGNPVETNPERICKKSKAVQCSLTERDLQILLAIHAYGGVLTTVQLNMLFWPPDLRRRLELWGLSGRECERWLREHDSSRIYSKTEQLKWGIRLNRLRQKRVLTRSDRGLAEWLNRLDRKAATELVTWLDEIAQSVPKDWLSRAFVQGIQPPTAFAMRSQLPSGVVSSACKIRLRHLAENNFTQPYLQATRPEVGRAQTCWFLTRQGHKLVATAKDVRASKLEWKPAGAYGLLHLTHRLLLNDVRVAVHLACREKGYQVRRWIDDNDLRRLLSREKVTLRRLVQDGQSDAGREVEERHSLKIPDGYVWLDMGAVGERHCFIELDNQTLTLSYSEANPKDYAQKIRTLSAFYKGGRYKDLFPEAGDSMWLLTVTSGNERRLKNLKQTTEKAIGAHNKAADRYWFTTMDKLPTWQDPFGAAVFSPIWLRAGQEREWQLDKSIG